MFNLHDSSIKAKLSAIGLARLAREHGFDTVYRKKINAEAFLLGFMKMCSHRVHSLTHWASCVSSLTGQPVSKQAIDQRLSKRYSPCMRALMEALMAQQNAQPLPAIGKQFTRVLIQDSTCWSLPRGLADDFPGSHSKRDRAATARLQVSYDLKAQRFHEFALHCFRENDQGHASQILQWVEAGDLVIRDLGYFSQHVFADLEQKEAFFVSRLHYRVNLYHEGEVVEMDRLIRGRKHIDMNLVMGAQAQLPVRVIGIKLPAAQAAARRRKAQHYSGTKMHAAYRRWLGWTFFITNLPSARYSAAAIDQLYRLRWRIELIFKGFKSGLNWSAMFAKASLKAERVIMTTYAMVIYVLLCWRCYQWFLQQPGCSRLSLLKFLPWFSLHYDQIAACHDLRQKVATVAKLCSYERGKHRQNYWDQLALSLG